MTPKQAKNAIEFLKRTQLSGAEVDAFTDVVIALQRLLVEPPRADQKNQRPAAKRRVVTSPRSLAQG